ncbi:hypothetical protein OpiT1DRAFT_04012 [Opitutaceae bacterium TAV1]|nr:hypothetical protein OpiT1DRAFT_04012 [Opitutaceae bacterium TAV1]
MSRTVTELGFAITTPTPAATPGDVERLACVLRAADGWLTAGEIVLRLDHSMSERAIRAAASAAVPEVISFPGSPGYRHFSRCTVDEIQRCIDTLRSQGTEMLKRAVIIQRALHNRRLRPHSNQGAIMEADSTRCAPHVE